MSEEKNANIEKLIENEKIMAALYNSYGEKFPFFSEFWKELGEEEIGHAEWIRSLYDKKGVGLIQTFNHEFPLQAVEEAVEHINKKLKESKENKIALTEALEVSLHIENTMLENKFFQVFESDALEVKIILEALRLSTQEHRERIRKMWLKETGQINAEMEAKME